MPKKRNLPRKNTRYSRLRKKTKIDLKKRLSNLRSVRDEYSSRAKKQGGQTPQRHKGWTWMGLCEEIGRTHRILNEK